ncbi:hypothetical protein QEH56_04045 [Pelagicoccus enzymogenes]|uniref:pyroglutamyl-peptidase I family protein n=1 Tax=Pelagicoccus enzymogenes TaxID=2773457 RepID=UPI00280D3EAA|nr:hypothetical protein [Pelagicoccus enzymogenes]MDQ8197302.1 hypothetical protein [Pelagicoccus enzymogenes]
MPARAKILITSFQPFRGRERNGSQTIATALESTLAEHHVQHLSLPVSWGVIEEIALPQMERLNPDIVLGLGEGTPCFLKVETLAFNQRIGIDESKTAPASKSIDSAGPPSCPSRWPLPESLVESLKSKVTISGDAGRFLCNNALYRFSRSHCPFAGFFHLPPQGATADYAYLEQWLPVAEQLLESAIQQVPTP